MTSLRVCWRGFLLHLVVLVTCDVASGLSANPFLDAQLARTFLRHILQEANNPHADAYFRTQRAWEFVGKRGDPNGFASGLGFTAPSASIPQHLLWQSADGYDFDKLRKRVPEWADRRRRGFHREFVGKRSELANFDEDDGDISETKHPGMGFSKKAFHEFVGKRMPTLFVQRSYNLANNGAASPLSILRAALYRVRDNDMYHLVHSRANPEFVGKRASEAGMDIFCKYRPVPEADEICAESEKLKRKKREVDAGMGNHTTDRAELNKQLEDKILENAIYSVVYGNYARPGSGKYGEPASNKRTFRREFIGKRGKFREFVGKRSPSEFSDKRGVAREFVGKRLSRDFVGKRLSRDFVGKRGLGMEFERKRGPSREFVGKRFSREFVGKRESQSAVDDDSKRGYSREFVGKRGYSREFVGKRGFSREFVGKRFNREFVGKRALPSIVDENDKRGNSWEFVGKRGHSREFVGKRGYSREFVGKRGYSREFVGKRGYSREFVGKRGNDELDDNKRNTYREFIGKRIPSPKNLVVETDTNINKDIDSAAPARTKERLTPDVADEEIAHSNPPDSSSNNGGEHFQNNE